MEDNSIFVKANADKDTITISKIFKEDAITPGYCVDLDLTYKEFDGIVKKIYED